MYPATFDYFRPRTLDEALGLLEEYGDEGKLLAGGQSLIPIMKLGLGSPEVLIDLNGLTELEYVDRGDTMLSLGALARHHALDRRAPASAGLRIITDALPFIADPQVRNRGTVAGALAEADPAGDWAPIFLALGGDVTCVSREGTRTISSDDFFQDLYTTAVRPNEIITEIRFRLPKDGQTGTYLKLERKTGDFAIVGVAVQVQLAEDGTCEDIGIGLSGVAAVPLRALGAEEALRGSDLGERAIDEAVAQLDPIMNPWTDMKGTDTYKRRMAGVYLRRALHKAVSRVAWV